MRGADSRSRFLEAFHNLLYLCGTFFQQDDDTTVIADGFPVLNALKEVHLLLTQGAHNQFGDLPSTARQEMLIQQWILARPEFREFLPTRIMVAYPERWMDRVDAMKTLQGWTDVSVLHFRNLGVFGEQILLSVRFGAWSTVNDPVQASNWARFWRAEIQGYTHAYRAVTGVDLTSEITDVRQANERYLQPCVHLQKRLASQVNQLL
jgi:D-ribose pyranose/furanose isomerase RbsD